MINIHLFTHHIFGYSPLGYSWIDVRQALSQSTRLMMAVQDSLL